MCENSFQHIIKYSDFIISDKNTQIIEKLSDK